MASTQHDVFLTGGTGFMGSGLTRELQRRGHHVRALVRPGSESKLVPGCDAVRGDALDAESYASQIAPADTFVHLVGVTHPNPRKAAEFRAIDLKSCQEAVGAVAGAGVRHFVYLSVARPARPSCGSTRQPAPKVNGWFVTVACERPSCVPGMCWGRDADGRTR